MNHTAIAAFICHLNEASASATRNICSIGEQGRQKDYQNSICNGSVRGTHGTLSGYLSPPPCQTHVQAATGFSTTRLSYLVHLPLLRAGLGFNSGLGAFICDETAMCKCSEELYSSVIVPQTVTLKQPLEPSLASDPSRRAARHPGRTRQPLLLPAADCSQPCLGQARRPQPRPGTLSPSPRLQWYSSVGLSLSLFVWVWCLSAE